MEPFVRSFDAGSPVTSGRRYLLSLATRTVLAMGHGVQRMKAETRGALTELVSFEVTWPLSLLLGGWQLQSRGEALAKAAQLLLAPSGATGLWSSLAAFSGPLSRFMQAAHDATDEAGLAAAGVYFEAAVESVSVSLLSMVLRSTSFRPVVTALSSQFPPPSDLAAEYQRRMQGRGQPAPASLPSSAMQDRRRSFEHADFGARRPLPSRAEPPEAALLALNIPSPTDASTLAAEASTDRLGRPRAPAATTSAAKKTTAKAYLAQAGWSAQEIAAFLAGPTRDRGA